MAIKLRREDGGSRLWFWVMVAFVGGGFVEATIAWQGYDDCGQAAHNKAWQIAPPTWECHTSPGIQLWEDGPKWGGL